jgi:hypothetical protein
VKLTKGNVDEMNSILIDIRDAREVLEEQISELQGQLEDLLKVIS